MKELKLLNDKLFYGTNVRKDKHKSHVFITITLASALNFTGFIVVKLTRQYKFARNIKISSLDEKYRDKYFLSIIDSIKEIKDFEDMVLYLISIGLYDILKRVDFLEEIVSKYKLLKE